MPTKDVTFGKPEVTQWYHTAIDNTLTIAQLVKIIMWILWRPEVHQRECRNPYLEIVRSKLEQYVATPVG
jgi:hypothetical protein